MKAFDKKDWSKAKASVTRSSNTIKGAVQNLIEMGLSHYVVSGDTVFLTEAMSFCEGQRSLPNETIKAYIMAHANVRWVVSTKKEGDNKVQVKRFKKQGSDVAVTEPGVSWWEHEANKQNVAKAVNTDNAIASLIKRIEKALTEGNADNPEKAQKQLDGLKALVA